jgi:phosphopantothenoylcysteine decarboxylase/phosphopantothenate--cysteine ligase
VAFAAETHDVLANARRKLADKRADLLVVNDIGLPGCGFESDENEVVILSPGGGEEQVARASKTVVAGRILDRIAALLEVRCPKGGAVTR